MSCYSDTDRLVNNSNGTTYSCIMHQTVEDVDLAKRDCLVMKNVGMWTQMFNINQLEVPTETSSKVATWATFLMGQYG